MPSRTEPGETPGPPRSSATTPQLALGVNLPDYSSLDNFHADNNAEALATVTALGGGELRGAVCLCGPAGSGKSHLLQAACRHAHEQGRRAVYLPLDQFRQAGAGGLEGLDQFDLVALDSVDSIAGVPEVEAALFHLVRRLLDQESGLLVAAPSAPAGMGWTLPDLASRLASGPVIRLQPLDDHGREQALCLRARRRGMELAPEAARYLLRRQSRAPAELFRLLDELDVASLAAQRRLTIPFLREALDAGGQRGNNG